MATPKCLIGHPERIKYLTEIAVQSGGLCVHGEPVCLVPEHRALVKAHWNAHVEKERLRKSRVDMGLCVGCGKSVAVRGHRRVGKADGYCRRCLPSTELTSVVSSEHTRRRDFDDHLDGVFAGCAGCHDYTHLYQFVRDEAIAHWAAEDQVDAHREHKRFMWPIPTGERGRFGSPFDPVKRDQHHATQPPGAWKLKTVLYDHHTSQIVARVVILNTPVQYDVFIESGVGWKVPAKGLPLHKAARPGRKLTPVEQSRVLKAADRFGEADWNRSALKK